jgi:hypothetical protein
MPQRPVHRTQRFDPQKVGYAARCRRRERPKHGKCYRDEESQPQDGTPSWLEKAPVRKIKRYEDEDQSNPRHPHPTMRPGHCMSQRQRVGSDDEAVDGVPEHRSGYRKAYGTEDEEPADRIAWMAGGNDRADEDADDYTDEEG